MRLFRRKQPEKVEYFILNIKPGFLFFNDEHKLCKAIINDRIEIFPDNYILKAFDLRLNWDQHKLSFIKTKDGVLLVPKQSDDHYQIERLYIDNTALSQAEIPSRVNDTSLSRTYAEEGKQWKNN